MKTLQISIFLVENRKKFYEFECMIVLKYDYFKKDGEKNA